MNNSPIPSHMISGWPKLAFFLGKKETKKKQQEAMLTKQKQKTNRNLLISVFFMLYFLWCVFSFLCCFRVLLIMCLFPVKRSMSRHNLNHPQFLPAMKPAFVPLSTISRPMPWPFALPPTGHSPVQLLRCRWCARAPEGDEAASRPQLDQVEDLVPNFTKGTQSPEICA